MNASAVPVTVGVVTLLDSAVTTGCAGAVESTTITAGVANVLVTPAALVAVAVIE